jgi:hypothetical protein
MSRHGRQTRLAEVGAAGQARIVAATVDVPMVGLSGDVASRYLAGAGVVRLRVRSAAIAAAASAIDPSVRVEIDDPAAPRGSSDDRRLARSCSPTSDWLDLRDPVARDLALGARAALRVLRAVLEGGP